MTNLEKKIKALILRKRYIKTIREQTREYLFTKDPETLKFMKELGQDSIKIKKYIDSLL